jgi:hypothetical protein
MSTPVQQVTVSLVLVLEGNAAAITEAKLADLYDETIPNTSYARCVELAGLDDPAATTQLHSWVKNNVRAVIFHSGTVTSLKLGNSGLVGLTSDLDGTGTKTTRALVDTAIAPITLDALRLQGIIP